MPDHTQENITTPTSDVQDKRSNLLNSDRNLQVGRREKPKPYDPRPQRLVYARGLILGAVVVIVALALIMAVAPGIQIG